MQNLWPWEAYHFYKIRMSKKNLSAVNDTLLFHGSSEVNPYDTACEEDVRSSKQGSWGRAVYFFESAPYSNQYAHCSSNYRELILANVLTANAFDFGTEKKKGLTRQTSIFTRVYMICENYKAYPVNIIWYKVLSISATCRFCFLFMSCFHVVDELFRVYVLSFSSLLGL